MFQSAQPKIVPFLSSTPCILLHLRSGKAGGKGSEINAAFLVVQYDTVILFPDGSYM